MIIQFTTKEYENDPVFQELEKKWNVYLNADENDDDILTEWEEVLLKEFYREAINWMKIHKDDNTWRKNLV